MAEQEPVLKTWRAQRGTGTNAIDGVLMISRSRVKWEPSDPSKAQPSQIELSMIQKTQQAPGKPFIKLDTAAGPLVLGFPTLPERDDAVELLKQLKPPGAGGGGSSKAGSGSQGGSAAGSPGGGAPGGAGGLLLPSAQQAAALFRADRDLESVYKSLVVSGILPEPDFWRARQAQLRTALAPGGVLAAGGGGGGSSGGGPAPARRQRLGLPNAMLADVKPSADGQTEKVHFQLTPQAIQQIFTERPEVHRAYLAHVPASMDEKAFWTRYFKLQYRRMARRRRQGVAPDAALDDEEEDELFAPFRKQLQEQEQQRARRAMAAVDPTVNLAADAGERFSAAGGFGSARDAGADPAAALRSAGLGSLARDINRHAAAVLEGAPEGLAELEPGGAGGDNETSRIAKAIAAQQQRAAAAAAKAAAGTSSGSGGGAGEAADAAVPPERLEEWQARAASALEDLTLDDRERQYSPLNIRDPRAYFDAASSAGTAAGQQDGAAKPAAGQQQTAAAAVAPAAAPSAALVAALAAVRPLALPDPPCDPAAASAVLLELSQGQDESLVAEFGPVAAAALQFPPSDRTHGLQQLLLEHLRGEALKTDELLRHMWGALPLLSAARADKAARLARALQEQRALLQSHMQAHPGTSQQVHVTLMLRPLAEAADAALQRYQQEQQRRQLLQQRQQQQAAAGKG